MAMTEYEDPIVKEIHETRARLLQEYGGSEGYAAHLREVEQEFGNRVVTRKPRGPTEARKIS